MVHVQNLLFKQVFNSVVVVSLGPLSLEQEIAKPLDSLAKDTWGDGKGVLRCWIYSISCRILLRM